jgi:hypothetical protein
MIALVAIWVAAYSVSCAPIGWIALVENSTPQLRTQTAGIAAVLQSCSGVIFVRTAWSHSACQTLMSQTYSVPLMLSSQYAGWGAKIGFFFGPLAAIFTGLVYFAVPETKGRSYAELDELFERRIPAWRFKDTRTSAQDAVEREREGRQDVAQLRV